MQESFTLGPIQTKWVDYMEKHPEQQGFKSLGYEENGKKYYCCLGILSEIAGTAFWVDGVLRNKTDNCRGMPIAKELHLHYSSGAVVKGITDEINSLVHINDNGGKWPEISALVRANPQHYFTQSF